MPVVVAMIDGEHQVDCRKQGEDEGLEERHPDTQSKEDGRHDHRYEVQHLGEDRVVAVDVAEQAQGEEAGRMMNTPAASIAKIRGASEGRGPSCA